MNIQEVIQSTDIWSSVLELFQDPNYDVITKDDGSEELVPDVPQFIVKISLEEKRITINFPEWI